MSQFDGTDQAYLSIPRTEEDNTFRPPIMDRRLFDITHGAELPNGESGLFERLAAEVERFDWTNQEIDLFNLAIEDMVRIHDSDMRGEHRSYVHMLRGAIRIISEGEQYFGVRDHPDLIIAQLLHDSVEDFVDRWLSPEQLATLDLTKYEDKLRAQQMAFCVIEKRYCKIIPEGYVVTEGEEPEYVNDPSFGTRVSRITEWMTSKPYPEDLNKDADKVEYQKRKWGHYETGVRLLYGREDAYGAKLLKTGDIVENHIGGMRHHEDPSKRVLHARKYIFLFDAIVEYIMSSNILSDERKRFQCARFVRAFGEAKQVISDHIKEHPEDLELFDTSMQEAERVLGRIAIDHTPIAS